MLLHCYLLVFEAVTACAQQSGILRLIRGRASHLDSRLERPVVLSKESNFARIVYCNKDFSGPEW